MMYLRKKSFDIFLTKFGNSDHVVMETKKILKVASSRKVIFHFGSNLPKDVPNTITSIFLLVDRSQDIDLAHFLGD